MDDVDARRFCSVHKCSFLNLDSTAPSEEGHDDEDSDTGIFLGSTEGIGDGREEEAGIPRTQHQTIQTHTPSTRVGLKKR